MPMDKKEFEAVIQSIKDNTRGKTLNLNSKSIDAAQVSALAAALASNRTVQVLNLGFNQIGAAGAEALAKALATNATVRELYLDGNQIGDVGAGALAKVLATNKTVQWLDLGDNQIGDAGAEALAKALASNRTLQGLNLSFNQIGAAGAEALAKTLVTNRTVQTLYLGNNQIGAAGAAALAKALASNRTVQGLFLIDNQIGAAGAAAEKAIQEAIERNQALAKQSPPVAALPMAAPAPAPGAQPAVTALAKPAPGVPEAQVAPVSYTGAGPGPSVKGDAGAGAPSPLLIQAVPALVASPHLEIKQAAETIAANRALSPTERDLLNTLQSLNLTPDFLQQFQQQLVSIPLQLTQIQDYTGWMRNMNTKLAQLEQQTFTLTHPQAQREQAYINSKPQLKAYQYRLQKELSAFITCYFLAPAGIFKLEDNKKDLMISVIGGLPLAGQFLKILTSTLSFANKQYRLYHINHIAELFSGLEHISQVCQTFARQLTLAKETPILQQQEIVYSGIAKVKGWYQVVKETLDNQWKDLATSNTRGVSLTSQDKLAVLDCAAVLQLILSAQVKLNKTQDLVPQLFKALGVDYPPRVLPSLPSVQPAPSPVAVAVAVPVPAQPTSPTQLDEMNELRRLLAEQQEFAKKQAEEFKAQQEKQRLLEEQLRRQMEENDRRERARESESAEMRALKKKLESLGIDAGSGGNQAQALALPFSAGHAAANVDVTMLYQLDGRVKRLEFARLVEEEAEIGAGAGADANANSQTRNFANTTRRTEDSQQFRSKLFE